MLAISLLSSNRVCVYPGQVLCQGRYLIKNKRKFKAHNMIMMKTSINEEEQWTGSQDGLGEYSMQQQQQQQQQ